MKREVRVERMWQMRVVLEVGIVVLCQGAEVELFRHAFGKGERGRRAYVLANGAAGWPITMPWGMIWGNEDDSRL